ncbi:MAG TPA: GAF domain-containing protein, partial [Thermodesulfobacteriota bacterium]|nr:GAF domain-containing protein [Thermodesulfobacteriota bacterium]
MRPRNVAIVGANRDALALLPLLERDPTVRVRLIADRSPRAVVSTLEGLDYQLAARYGVRVAHSLEALAQEPDLDLIIDASRDPETSAAVLAHKPAGATVMSALSARLIWETRAAGGGRGEPPAVRREALLGRLAEVVGAVQLTANEEELLSLVLSVAIESTGAERGSLLLLDPEERVLRVRVAVGLPPEVARAVRIPLGEGIAGRVARDGQPLRLSGPVERG